MIRGSGPKNHQTPAVTIAIATTVCTKYAAMRSASFWIGARVRWACATMCTICESRVSEPTRSARKTKEPLPFTVAPVTRAPASLATGTGSPVIMDSSTRLAPSRTVPSTGTFSPGFTRRWSPTLTASSGTCSSVPSPRRRQARLGASSSSCRIAWLVWPIARNCSTSPSMTSVTMTAAASK
ncbi:hypothetical protein D3C83_10770 [compost metagenome]